MKSKPVNQSQLKPANRQAYRKQPKLACTWEEASASQEPSELSAQIYPKKNPAFPHRSPGWGRGSLGVRWAALFLVQSTSYLKRQRYRTSATPPASHTYSGRANPFLFLGAS